MVDDTPSSGRASSPFIRDKPQGFVSPHLLWVPNRNRAGTGGGRRAVGGPEGGAGAQRCCSSSRAGVCGAARRCRRSAAHPGGAALSSAAPRPGAQAQEAACPAPLPATTRSLPWGRCPGLAAALSLLPGFSDAPSRVAGPRARPAPQTPAWRGTCPPPPTCTWRSRSTSRPMRTSWRGTKVRDPCDGLRGGAGPVGTVFPFPNQSYPRVGTSKQQPEPALGTVRCSG